MITQKIIDLAKSQLAGQMPKEVRENYPYFHRATIGGAGAGLTSPLDTVFFNVNTGGATNRDLDTNYGGQPNVLDGQRLWRIRGFALGLPVTVSKANAVGILANDVMEFRIGDKVYFRAELQTLGCAGGAYGLENTTMAGSTLVTNGQPHTEDYLKVGSDNVPIVVNPQERFEYRVRSAFATGVTRCRAVIFVDEFRTA